MSNVHHTNFVKLVYIAMAGVAGEEEVKMHCNYGSYTAECRGKRLIPLINASSCLCTV